MEVSPLMRVVTENLQPPPQTIAHHHAVTTPSVLAPTPVVMMVSSLPPCTRRAHLDSVSAGRTLNLSPSLK